MSAKRTKDKSESAPTRGALGIRAIRGGGVVVAVAFDRNTPRVAASSFIATADQGDRLAREPYHVAVEMKRRADGKPSAEATAAVAEGRKRQDQLAAKNLKELIEALRRGGFEPTTAALLVNRAGWVTDLLSYSLAFADHPPVAEGLAVRDAFRFAIKRVKLALAEVDEKSLPDLAAALRLGSASVDAQLKVLGAQAGKPWRKEQKLACLAAWVTLAAHS
jgi:hypothetical protein